jgi:hypothetical protein
MNAHLLPVLLGLLSLCALACGGEPKDAVPPAELAQDPPAELTTAEPEELPADAAAEPAGSGCRVANETEEPLELIAAAIDEVLGVVSPGESGHADGHFEARAASGHAVTGFCPTGHSLRIVLQQGVLVVLDNDDAPAREGAAMH